MGFIKQLFCKHEWKEYTKPWREGKDHFYMPISYECMGLICIKCRKKRVIERDFQKKWMGMYVEPTRYERKKRFRSGEIKLQRRKEFTKEGKE